MRVGLVPTWLQEYEKEAGYWCRLCWCRYWGKEHFRGREHRKNEKILVGVLSLRGKEVEPPIEKK